MARRLRLACTIALVAIAASWLPACGRAAAPPLDLAIDFRALWWSEAQMEGLDPNAPPPKTTEVVLQKWEYSDPVGVPHPDVVDIVVHIRNRGEALAAQQRGEITVQWKEGPRTKFERAAWRAPQPQLTFPIEGLAAGQTVERRIRVDLARKMADLSKQRQWPWALKATVRIVSAPPDTTGAPFAEAVLPVTPGD